MGEGKGAVVIFGEYRGSGGSSGSRKLGCTGLVLAKRERRSSGITRSGSEANRNYPCLVVTTMELEDGLWTEVLRGSLESPEKHESKLVRRNPCRKS
ncbi:unnamed protein product [Arabis nemorensis]|uniref:Uncharacterized protein n=1 Tax=Arabis nemorensis TaxID=586526 RepID=A0A565ASZ6_9BRAS|nr:unnamed protein product [Arabis nemorensis]